MKILISPGEKRPIYAQIAEQIKEQILSGDIPEGSYLPSIRKLAQELGCSVITTTRAYEELEKEGFTTSLQGKGCLVLKKDSSLLREQYLKRIEENLEAAMETAQVIQLEKEELLSMLSALYDAKENEPL